MKHVAYIGIEIESKTPQDCALKAIELMEGLRKNSDTVGESHLFATDDKPVREKAGLITFVLYECFRMDFPSIILKQLFQKVISAFK